MQIDFKALEQALAPIEAIGQGELTFEAGGTTITLRVLRPHEEIEAQKYASVAMDGDGDHVAIDYLDRFRFGCLSYAIVAVGSQDFRNVEYVTTGEALDNGTEIKVPKHKAMRQVLSRWTRAALSGVFAKFHELLMKTEQEAEAAIVYVPASIPSEIERLHQRIAELRGEMEKAQAIEKTKFSDTVGMAEAQLREAALMRPSGPPQDTKPLEEEPSPQVLPPAQRRTGPITPQQAVPPPDRSAPPQMPPSTMQGVGTSEPQRPVAPRPDSSFINADDEEGMNAAMAAEHQRLLERRRAAATGHTAPDDESALMGIHPQVAQPPRRRPPHQGAADVESEVGLVDARAEKARELGATPDGVPVFALPAQDLEMPGPRPRPDQRALDPQMQGGTTNPRFQPARRPDR